MGLPSLHFFLDGGFGGGNGDASDSLVLRSDREGQAMKKSWWHILAIIMIGVAGLDLLFGNLVTGSNSTGQQSTGVLPSFLTNLLTTQWDLILIGIGAFLLWWA